MRKWSSISNEAAMQECITRPVLQRYRRCLYDIWNYRRKWKHLEWWVNFKKIFPFKTKQVKRQLGFKYYYEVLECGCWCRCLWIFFNLEAAVSDLVKRFMSFVLIFAVFGTSNLCIAGSVTAPRDNSTVIYSEKKEETKVSSWKKNLKI